MFGIRVVRGGVWREVRFARRTSVRRWGVWRASCPRWTSFARSISVGMEGRRVRGDGSYSRLTARTIPVRWRDAGLLSGVEVGSAWRIRVFCELTGSRAFLAERLEDNYAKSTAVGSALSRESSPVQRGAGTIGRRNRTIHMGRATTRSLKTTRGRRGGTHGVFHPSRRNVRAQIQPPAVLVPDTTLPSRTPRHRRRERH